MSLILICLAIVALIWGMVLTLRGSVLVYSVGFLVFTSCFGFWFMKLNAGPISLTLDRAFLLFLLATFAVQWKLGNLVHRPLTYADAILLAFVGMIATSLVVSPRGEGDGSMQHFINGYLIPLLVYGMIRHTKLTEQAITQVFVCMFVFGLYLSLTGIFEILGLWKLVFPRYIANPEIGLHFGRARGPMIQSVSYGFYLDVILVTTWMLRRRIPPHWQLILLLCLPLFPAAIFCTKTRTIWVGAATAFFIVMSLQLKGRMRIGLILGVLAACLAVGVAKFDSILGLQREGTVEDTKKSVSMRGGFAYVSWLMFLDRPVLGVGFGNFAEAKMPYLHDRSTEIDLESIREYAHHNTFLSILTELGLVGTLVQFSLFGCWLFNSWKLIRSSSEGSTERDIGIISLATIGIAFWQMIGHEITFTTHDHTLWFMVSALMITKRQEQYMQEVAAGRRQQDPVLGQRVTTVPLGRLPHPAGG